MNWLYKLERRYRWAGVPNLMIYITAAMLVVFMMSYLMRVPIVETIYFNRSLILGGEIWRILTFVFIPPGGGILWTIIALYFYYFIGSSLENSWGTFLFTAYYVIGILGAIAAGFISGGVDNTYLNLSLFFAFAMLFPDHRVLLFFIIPVKIKYLAFANAFLFALLFLQGGMVTRVSILFSLANFFLFFGRDTINKLKQNARYSKRRREFRQNMNNHRDMWR